MRVWWETTGQVDPNNNIGRHCDAPGYTGREWKVVADDGEQMLLRRAVDTPQYVQAFYDEVTNLY